MSPNAIRIKSVLKVREEWGGWMIGYLVRFPDVKVELGWEDWQTLQPQKRTFTGTALTYIAMWRGKQCLYEFQFGQSLVRPPEDIGGELIKLLQLMQGYTPFNLMPRFYVKDFLKEGPHELSVQPLPKRQDQRKRQPVRRGRCNKKAKGMYRLRVPVHHS